LFIFFSAIRTPLQVELKTSITAKNKAVYREILPAIAVDERRHTITPWPILWYKFASSFWACKASLEEDLD
jgi:hypothetical protein